MDDDGAPARNNQEPEQRRSKKVRTRVRLTAAPGAPLLLLARETLSAPASPSPAPGATRVAFGAPVARFPSSCTMWCDVAPRYSIVWLADGRRGWEASEEEVARRWQEVNDNGKKKENKRAVPFFLPIFQWPTAMTPGYSSFSKVMA